MKTTSKELQAIWPELEDIFLKFKRMTPKIVTQLESLGFTVSQGKHPKIRIGDKLFVLSSTPSDNYAGRQILRVIRRYYENEKQK